MENFKLERIPNSKLYLEVKVYSPYFGKVYVEKLNSIDNTNSEEIVTSNPGSASIDFTKIGKIEDFSNHNCLKIASLFVFNSIKNQESFSENLKIEYQIVQDDEKPSIFIKSQNYFSTLEEILVSDDKLRILVVKKIKIS